MNINKIIEQEIRRVLKKVAREYGQFNADNFPNLGVTFDKYLVAHMPIEEEKEDLRSALYRIISENKPYTCWKDYDKPVEEILKLINK